VVRDLVDGVVVVSEGDIIAAMQLIYERLKVGTPVDDSSACTVAGCSGSRELPLTGADGIRSALRRQLTNELQLQQQQQQGQETGVPSCKAGLGWVCWAGGSECALLCEQADSPYPFRSILVHPLILFQREHF
jgi:hypothetical protein